MTWRVVIDTSSLVSYVLTQGKLMSQVIAHWRGEAFKLLSSSKTRHELEEVLRRPAIQRMATAPADDVARGIERFSSHVPGKLRITGACRDPKDDKFLACAVEGQAHYLISSDRDLLDMRIFQGVAIVSPGQFLLALELHRTDIAAIATRFSRETLTDILANVPLDPDTAGRLREALNS